MHMLTKYLGLAFILAIMLAAFAVSAAPAQQGVDVTTTAQVSLRAGPGTEWARIAVLPAGTPFRVDGRAPGGGWARGITPDGQIGWILASNLTITQAQMDALPGVWVDTPFNLGAPGGAAAASVEQPPAQPAAEAQAVVDPPPAASIIHTAPVTGFSYGGHVDGFSMATVANMQRAGMTWVKKQWRYLAGQSPASVAGWINDAHGKGFRILVGIVGQPGDVNTPGYFDQYAGFVAGVAALGADAIEVWNEQNIDREWQTGTIDPAKYTELLKQAYTAIKAANPNTLVISGAPAPTGFFGGCSANGCDDNVYLQGMAAAGAAQYMDCIGAHYNEGIVPPTQTSGDPRANDYYTRYFSSMLNVYHGAFGGARPVCWTELGYLTPEGFPPLPSAFGWAQDVTLAQQASWLDQAVSMSASSGRVRLLIVWNVDFTAYGADPMAGYAIIRPNGTCPACDALAS